MARMNLRSFPWLGFGIVCACSTTKKSDALPPIDTRLEQKQATPRETIGLNSQGEAIVQKEDSAPSALVTVEHVNENLKLDLKQQFHLLKECRTQLAQSHLGGSGDYPELSDFDNLQAQYEKTEVMGVEDGTIKYLERSKLKDRLAAQQNFQRDLRNFLRTVKKEREKCDFQLQEAERRSDSRK